MTETSITSIKTKLNLGIVSAEATLQQKTKTEDVTDRYGMTVDCTYAMQGMSLVLDLQRPPIEIVLEAPNGDRIIIPKLDSIRLKGRILPVNRDGRMVWFWTEETDVPHVRQLEHADQPAIGQLVRKSR